MNSLKHENSDSTPISNRALLYFEVPRLRTLVLLIRVVLRWKWVWNIGGMMLTGESELLGERHLSQRLSVRRKSHMGWPGIDPGPLRWEAGVWPPKPRISLSFRTAQWTGCVSVRKPVSTTHVNTRNVLSTWSVQTVTSETQYFSTTYCGQCRAARPVAFTPCQLCVRYRPLPHASYVWGIDLYPMPVMCEV